MLCIIYHVRSPQAFNGLCTHYPVSVFSPCLLRVPPNGRTNRFRWDCNYSSFVQWASDSKAGQSNYKPMMPHLASTMTRARERANSPIRLCQITHHACLSFVSTMVLLPVSICFLSGWWLMGSSEEYHVTDSSSVSVARSGSVPPSVFHAQKHDFPRNANLIETFNHSRMISFAYFTYKKAERVNWEIAVCQLMKGKKQTATGMKLPSEGIFKSICAIYTQTRCDVV